MEQHVFSLKEPSSNPDVNQFAFSLGLNTTKYQLQSSNRVFLHPPSGFHPKPPSVPPVSVLVALCEVQ